MYDEDIFARICDYIRQNKATYTTEAIRYQLIRDGIPVELVDRALAEQGVGPQHESVVRDADAGTSTARRQTSLGLLLLGVAAASVVGNVLIVLTLVGLVALDIDSSSIYYTVVLLGLAVEIALAVAYARRRTLVHVGLVIAFALTPVVVAVLLAGGCVVILSNVNLR